MDPPGLLDERAATAPADLVRDRCPRAAPGDQLELGPGLVLDLEHGQVHARAEALNADRDLARVRLRLVADTTGLVTAGTAPGLSMEVIRGGEFDAPVRFDPDHRAVTLRELSVARLPADPMLELRG